MRHLLWPPVLFLVVATGCSSSEGPACAKPEDCEAGRTCLSTGACAAQCSGDEACGAEERCGPSGACIAKNACGEGPACGDGQVCNVDRCVAEEEASSCGSEAFEATHVPPNMHVLLDRSSSMSDEILVEGESRTLWSIAVSTVKQTTSRLEDQLRFGLQLFPISRRCAPGPVLVEVGERTASAISAALPSSDPTDPFGTPLAAALTSAGSLPALQDSTRSNFVLLITDGEETCSGNPSEAAAALLRKGIRTYVVGFGAGVSATTLESIARSGGTARASGRAYYQADSAAALDQALDEIGRGAAGCDFALGTAPPDPNLLYVYVNGEPVTRDASHADGWDYDAEDNRITFYGGSCESLAADAAAKLKVVYGCPVPPIG